MREPAVMSKTEDRSAKITQHVDVRGFGRERERGGGQRRLAIQPCATEAGASQEMGDRFQLVRILSDHAITDQIHCHFERGSDIEVLDKDTASGMQNLTEPANSMHRARQFSLPGGYRAIRRRL